MSRECPSCHKPWPADVVVCPEDGTRLTTAEARVNPAAPTRLNPVERAATALALEQQPSDELLPGTKIGEFEIQGQIGVGGMAVVYSAIHPLIGKRAAIKVINRALTSHPDLVDRFLQEARAVNEIQHHHVVDVFSIGTLDDGRCYLIMEWLSGENLGDRLARGPLSIADTADILDQVCEALQAAHAKKIWHRDLKPDNLFLVPIDDRIQVKLLDFGIAKLADTQRVATSQTRTGTVMGTPDYMSPEQARGLNLDGATDVYSLGVVAFEMLTGRLPFVASNPADLLVKHLTETPPAPSSLVGDIPPALDAIVLRLLAKDPAQRPSLDEFRALLAEVYRSVLTDGGWAAPSSPSIAVLRRGIMTPIPGQGLMEVGDPQASEPSVPVATSSPSQVVAAGKVAAGKKGKRVGDEDPTLLSISGASARESARSSDRKGGSTARALRLALPLFVLGLLGGGAAMLFIPDARTQVENVLGMPDAGGGMALAQPAEPSAEKLVADEPSAQPGEDAQGRASAPAEAEPVEAAAMDKSAAPGFVSISTNVPAKIFVDGDLKERSARRARVRVSPGQLHTIKLQALNRRTIFRKVRVKPGDTEVVKVFLQKVGSKRRR